MPVAPKAEHRRRAPEPLGEVRERCDADAAADEQRTVDVEAEAVPERAEDRKPVAGLQRAKGSGPGPDRLDQERELAGGGEAERHRPRQEAARCLEHEELAGDPGLEPAAVDPQQCVGADLFVRDDATPLASHDRSVLAGTGSLRCGRSRSRGPRLRRPTAS